MSDAMLGVRNNHGPACGDPPILSGDDPNRYTGYFENAFGEQWLFTFDRTTRVGELRGGDLGWGTVVRTTDGSVGGLVLGPHERAWFEACWRSAAG